LIKIGSRQSLIAMASADMQILRSMQVLEPHANAQVVQQGEAIFRAGEPGDCFYGVLEGQVRIHWGEVDCGQTELLGAGRCFGEGTLVEPGNHTRHNTAIAEQPTKLLVMNRETFLFAMEALPMFGLELLASLERRLQNLSQPESD
jgi:CRP/FNR family cyclic AMP-dependent transcriptional regulator